MTDVRMRVLAWALLPVLLLALPAMARGQDLTCDRCHAELELLRQHTASVDSARAWLVPDSLVRASAHAELGCGECHTGFGRFPHPAGTSTQTCAACHAPADSAWSLGAHAAETDPVPCEACHTVHDVQSAEVLLSEAGSGALNVRCIACHETSAIAADMPHGAGVACGTCHAPHDVRPPDAPESRLAPAAQIATCGACHEEAASTFAGDVHGTRVQRGGAVEIGEGEAIEAPTCTTCHDGHGMQPASDPLFANVVGQERCASCHESYAEEFLDSYHGQAVALGGTAAATCSDCHTPHDVHPDEDPRSSVSEENLIATCATCHPSANASFVQFQPHANPHDREANPTLYWTYKFMTVLLFGVLGVFGLHTLLWVVRLAIDRARGRPAHGHGGGE